MNSLDSLSIIHSDRAWYEHMVLMAFVRDPDFRTKVWDKLCVKPSTTDTPGAEEFEPHFQEDEANAALWSIRHAFEMLGHDVPLESAIKMAQFTFRSQVAGEETLYPLTLEPYVKAALAACLTEEEDYNLVGKLLVQKTYGTWVGLVHRELLGRNVSLFDGSIDELSADVARRQAAAVFEDNDDDGLHYLGSGTDEVDEDDSGERASLEIPSLNLATGGGARKGESTLFIAPGGCGKTVMACQLTSCLSLQGYNGLFITTEQKHAELEPRIWSARCNIPFEKIKDGLRDEFLSDAERSSYKHIRKEIEKHVLFKNWRDSKEQHSVEGYLRKLVAQAKKKFGGKLDFIVLDWLGRALGELSRSDFNHLRLIYQSAADTVVDVAGEANLMAFVFAQTQPGAGLNTRRVDSTVLAECKSLGNNYTTIMGLTGMFHPDFNPKKQVDDPGEILYSDDQWINVSKARKGKTGVFPITREFKFQRFAARR